MAKQFWLGKESRKIKTRIIVEGDLILRTPAHFGNGDGDDLIDMLLLVDPATGKKPLLTGSSIAGAIRSYLCERKFGYRVDDKEIQASTLLFGGLKGDDNGEQSPLIIDDSLGSNFGIEVRSGISIDTKSRTTKEDALFELQLWQAGTKFQLRFELLICEKDNADDLKNALAIALQGFEDGGITLGARKKRGYGSVKVTHWWVKSYNLTTSQGLIDWLENGNKSISTLKSNPTIKSALGINSINILVDKRRFFQFEGIFSLDGSILIGSTGGNDDISPDTVHLSAYQPSSNFSSNLMMPIISGTSLGNTLRARALKISSMISRQKANLLVAEMFGKLNSASKIIVEEHPITGDIGDTVELIQNRVSIDRFTGGTRETALFNEQPLFGNDNSIVKVNIRLINPEKYQIGLLLLLVKDLWTRDLPLGGKSAIGRGRLKGKKAILRYQESENNSKYWEIELQPQDKISIKGNKDLLEEYVKALTAYLRESS